jgi:hypothetical protein
MSPKKQRDGIGARGPKNHNCPASCRRSAADRAARASLLQIDHHSTPAIANAHRFG